MYEFYDSFFFGSGKKSLSDIGIQSKKWAGLLIFYRLLDLVTGRFVYTFPDTMSDRFFEMCLLCGPGAAIIKDKSGEVINLRITAGNTVSRYGYYNNFQLVDYSGRSYGNFIPNCPGNIDPDAAIVYNNKSQSVAPIYRIKWYADRLTRIQGSINSCIMNMRGSTIIQCSKEQEKPIKKAFQDAEDGVPVILSFSEFEGGYQQEPRVITNPQTPALLKELQEAYDKTLSDFLTEFGINAHGVINKLAGVSTRELEQNAQATEIALKSAYNARVEGLEKASKMFGAELKCNVSFDIDYGEDDPKEEVVLDDVSRVG